MSGNMNRLIAELKIPRGFKLVKKPNFVDKSFILLGDLEEQELHWRDTTLEGHPWEQDLYIYIQKNKRTLRGKTK